MNIISITRKVIMALTGIGLVFFVVIHLIGNLQLLYSDNGYAFNKYADFMGNNSAIQASAWVIKIMILAHVVLAIVLSITNKKARPEAYAITNNRSSWISRNMVPLGIVLLAFIAVHLANFWGKFHYGSNLPMANYGNGEEYVDLYLMVEMAFGQWWLVAFYVISMLALSLHLVHGITSAFQSMGVNHSKYNPIIKYIGITISVVIPLGFAAIPLVMFFNLLS